MSDYNKLSSKEIFQKTNTSKVGQVLTGTSATVSAILVPIIITMLNQISSSTNSTVIIALSIICCITIVSTVFGIVMTRDDKGAINALNKDLDDIEHLINDHFEQDNDVVKPKVDASIDTIAKKLPKKMVKKKSQ